MERTWSELQEWLWEEAAAWAEGQNIRTEPVGTGSDPHLAAESFSATLRAHEGAILRALDDWEETGLWPELAPVEAQLLSMWLTWAGGLFEVLGNLEEQGWIGPAPAEEELRSLVRSLFEDGNRHVWWRTIVQQMDELSEGVNLEVKPQAPRRPPSRSAGGESADE